MVFRAGGVVIFGVACPCSLVTCASTAEPLQSQNSNPPLQSDLRSLGLGIISVLKFSLAGTESAHCSVGGSKRSEYG